MDPDPESNSWYKVENRNLKIQLLFISVLTWPCKKKYPFFLSIPYPIVDIGKHFEKGTINVIILPQQNTIFWCILLYNSVFKIGYETGLHVFELTWPVQQRGTHAVVGLATAAAPLHSVGYQSLIGNNDQERGYRHLVQLFYSCPQGG